MEPFQHENCGTKWAYIINWEVLADDTTAILPDEFGQVTLPLSESIK